MSMSSLIPVIDDLRPDDLPESAEAWLDRLPGPIAIRLAGRDRSRARVVSTLIHGNEPSGFRAMHALLRAGEIPAVDLLVLILGVPAAQGPPRFTRRVAPGRRDLNRCFLGPFEGPDAGPDAELAHAALSLARGARPEAVLDLHNNSGHNPVYGIGPRLDVAHLELCALFGSRFVLSRLQLGTFVEALDDVAPALTIECGRAGDPAADAAAHAGLVRFFRAERFDLATVATERFSVLVEPVRVRLRPGATVAFADAPDGDAALTLRAEIDRHNFEVLPAGTALGWVHAGAAWPVEATDEASAEISRELFAIEGDRLVARRTFVPIMMTTSPAIAASDCLFYAVRQRE
jgi:predicted deacylase